ncbi:MAG: hypothetical protein AB1847_17465 [bacterium]
MVQELIKINIIMIDLFITLGLFCGLMMGYFLRNFYHNCIEKDISELQSRVSCLEEKESGYRRPPLFQTETFEG